MQSQLLNNLPDQGHPFLGWLSRLDAQFLFNALLVYYVLLLHFVDTMKPVERFSPFYFALLIPVLLYVGVQWRALFPLRDRASIWLALFVAGSVAVSAFRMDFSTAYHAALMGAVGIIILNSRCAPSLTVLNVLFLASVPIALIMQQIGTNTYSLIPQQGDGCLDEEPWRVSLLPVVPESAFFAVIVLVANLLFARGVTRYLLCTIAAYFAILSSLRTALLALAFIAVFLALARLIPMRRQLLYAAYFASAAAVLILVASSSVLLRFVPDLGNEFLNVYLYRSNAGLQSPQQLSLAVHRSVVWESHLNLFLDNLPFGIGTAAGADSTGASSESRTSSNTKAYSAGAGSESRTSSDAHVPPERQAFVQRICRRAAQAAQDNAATASAPQADAATVQGGLYASQPPPTIEMNLCSACSFFTEWLARVGVVALFLLFFLASIVARAIATEDRFLFSACLLFLLISFTWGVLLVPYNPIFLLLLSSVYMAQRLTPQADSAPVFSRPA